MMPWRLIRTHTIHGTNGIFNYMKTHKSQQNVGKYTGPMDGMGKDDDFESMMITSM